MFSELAQELDRICQQDGAVLEKFNELLTQTLGSSAVVVNVDKTVEDARPNPQEEIAIETVQATVPKDGPSTKIIDHKNVTGNVVLHRDDKHYVLVASQDTKLPRGTKLGISWQWKTSREGWWKGVRGASLLSQGWQDMDGAADGPCSWRRWWWKCQSQKGTLYSVTWRVYFRIILAQYMSCWTCAGRHWSSFISQRSLLYHRWWFPRLPGPLQGDFLHLTCCHGPCREAECWEEPWLHCGGQRDVLGLHHEGQDWNEGEPPELCSQACISCNLEAAHGPWLKMVVWLMVV